MSSAASMSAVHGMLTSIPAYVSLYVITFVTGLVFFIDFLVLVYNLPRFAKAHFYSTTTRHHTSKHQLVVDTRGQYFWIQYAPQPQLSHRRHYSKTTRRATSSIK